MTILRSLLLTAAALSASIGLSAQTQICDKEIDRLRDSIAAGITGAEISPLTISVEKFGAKGDGVKDCRQAFRKAIARLSREGGGTLTVPAGVYFMRGPLELASNIRINLEEGATLRFSPDPADYPVVETSWEGTFLSNYSPMIYGRGLHNVAISGHGTIDGNAMTTFTTWKSKQKEAQMRSRSLNHSETDPAQRVFGDGDWLRPHLIQFYECSGVSLEGVKIVNSPFWCVHLLKSSNIICRGLRYDAKLVNNDGIDPECSRDILIEEIEFDNGDDNIAIKSGRDNDGWRFGSPSENIIIRNCRFKGLHAVVFGSEMSGGVRNVFIENCTSRGYCKRGIYVKTNPDRGGFVENIFVRNCKFDDVEDLFYVTSRYAGEGLDNDHYPSVRNIFVKGLSCAKASQAALVLQGTGKSPVSNVCFDNIEVGEAKIGLSFTNTENVKVNNSNIGGTVDIPTQISKADNIFGRDGAR